MSAPGDGSGRAAFTNMFVGSTVVVHRSRHSAPLPTRFRMVTATGAFGIGKRTDSWNVRVVFAASSVVIHSS
jgi:hypothetical protein